MIFAAVKFLSMKGEYRSIFWREIECKRCGTSPLRLQVIILFSSVVEHGTVNPGVDGSSPSGGVMLV